MARAPWKAPAGQLVQGIGGNELVAFLTRYSKVVAAKSVTAIHAAVTLPTTGTTTTTTGFSAPDVPRSVTVKGNQSSVTGDVVLTGHDAGGAVITETIASSGVSAVEGSKAFASITSVVFPTRGASGDTISIGTGSKLGLRHKLAHNTVVMAFLNNVLESTAPTVTVDATHIYGNTVKLNSALNGTAVDIYYYGSGVSGA